MTLVKHEIQVPKETKEVIDLIGAIVENVKAKKPVAEWVNLLDEVYAAVQGVDQVGEEVKAAKGATLAYLVEVVGSKF